ncbi:MAG: nicotinate-nucleotide--dimethylbenzimidazole phosphoribosyltransferase [Actinomycetota bacterium]
MSLLFETLNKIEPLDEEAMRKARERQDQLTKPAGSLGVLEDISVKLAGITGNVINEINKKTVVVMAADHGVTEEGVSAYPKEVTPQMVLNFVRGGAAINVLARHAGAEVVVVDIGVDAPINSPGVIQQKVRSGTANFAKMPAMDRDEAVRALEIGIEIAYQQIDNGTSLLATGDMGIGNTTPSSAILRVLTGRSIDEVVGRGTGIDDKSLKVKKAVIEKAIDLLKPNMDDPIDVLSKVGGLEIGGIAGLMIGAAARRVPVIIDGFISGAAALIASRISPQSIDYMIASHVSVEPGHRIMLEELGLKPMLHMNMRLGEGTGAVLAMNMVEAATKIIKEMATFAEAGVSEKETVLD